MKSRRCPQALFALPQNLLSRTITHAGTFLIATGLATGLAACGGGGGSDSGSPVLVEVPPRTIDVGNAEAVAKLALDMMAVTDVLTETFGLGHAINLGLCESGTGIGTVTDCAIGTNTFNGAVSSTTTDSKTVTTPFSSEPLEMPEKTSMAVSNLRWQSTSNTTSYNVNGNLLATYIYPINTIGAGSATVTGTLTLTDEANGTRFQYRSLTQRYAFEADSSSDSYDFNRSDQQGGLVYMDENAQYTITGGTVVEYLALSGAGASLAIRHGDDDLLYWLDIDSNSDGDYDVFSAMPLAEIGRGHTTSATAPTVSITRQGGGNDPANPVPVTQRLPTTLNATASDADYNFLTYSWVATDAQGSVVPGLLKTVNQRTSTVTFTATEPGEYVVTVTVTEVNTSNPKTATAQIPLYVAFNEPQFSIADLEGAEGVVDQPRTFAITQESAQGTITAQLLAAPPGMTLAYNAVDQRYELTWTPQSQFFPDTVENVTVQFANQDHATTKTFEVTVNDTSTTAPVLTPGLLLNSYLTGTTILNVDDDAAGELLLAGKDSLFAALDLDGADPVAALANPYELSNDANNLTGIKPLRRNGSVAAYVATSSRGVFVAGADTLALSAQRSLQFNLTGLTSKRRFDVADLDGDGNDEIIVLTKTINSTLGDQIHVLNQDLTTRMTTESRALGQEFLIGNVDTDSSLEIVCGNGVVLDGTTLATEIADGTLFGDHNYVLANVDNDSLHEILEVDAGALRVFDVDTLTSTNITFGFNADNFDLFGLNADSDATDELVVGTDNNVMHVFSINKITPSATLDRSIGTATSSASVIGVARGNVAGDSADDLVMIARRSNGAPLISVAALDGTLLQDGTTTQILTGGFASARAIDPAATSSIAIASMQDGNSATIGTLLLADTGGPTLASPFFDQNAGVFAVAADADGDDMIDIISNGATTSGGDAMIAAGAPGAVSPWQLVITDGSPAPVTAAQIDGSGNVDAVFIERSGTTGNETLDIVIHEIGGSELARATLQSSGPVLAAPVAITVANLDGDGNPDIVVLDQITLRTYEYAAGTLSAVATHSISATAKALAVADIDDDGIDEIAVARNSVTSEIEIYNAAWTQISQSSTTEVVTALAFYADDNERALLLAGYQTAAGSRNHISALDAVNLVEVWDSPRLNGRVNTIQVLSRDNGDLLQIGTSIALYRVQR